MTDAVVRDWVRIDNIPSINYSVITPQRVLRAAQAALGVPVDGKIGPMTTEALAATVMQSLQNMSASHPHYEYYSRLIDDMSDLENGKKIPRRIFHALVRLGLESIYEGDEIEGFTVKSSVRPVFRYSTLGRVSPRASGYLRPVLVVPSGNVASSESEAAADETKTLIVEGGPSTSEPGAPPLPRTGGTIAPAQQASFYEQNKTAILATAAVAVGVTVIALAFYNKD